MQKGDYSRGFTLIELSLSIVFISILSITIVMIIANAIAAYHRGLTLSSVNSVGMELTDDMRAAVQSSPAGSVTAECASVYLSSTTRQKCENDGAKKFVSINNTGTIKSNDGKETTKVPIYGAFCTGSYSYIWNSGYLFSDDYKVMDTNGNDINPVVLKYRMVNTTDSTTASDFRLLKVEDDARAVCLSMINSNYNLAWSDTFDITTYGGIDETPVDLLSTGSNLAIYSLTSSAPVGNGNSLFYSASFILGTTQGGVNIKSAGNFCKSPDGYSDSELENFDYCAINKFNFAARATGG
ncbi:hypothetical protein IJG89_01830 [Candidatus Saccharibacteria bacterium]|nr:hypothetical protein [Candidatus Saccharibacteria bacterium]